MLLILNSAFANTDNEKIQENEVDSSYSISSFGVPAGFEDIAGPQYNQIDVYYQGEFLISTDATYDFESLTFHNAEEVISQIDDLIDSEYILKHIKNTLPINSEKLCLSSSSDINCGKLEPNIVGIILDEGLFRVDLFISQQYLETQYIASSKYLPSAERKFSTIHNLSLNLSGTDEIEDRFNIQTNNIVSFGETRALAQSNYTDEEDFVIDELSLQHDYQDWEAEAGVFESETRSANFFSQVDITGISAKTSLKTRTDIKTNNATNIFIFLNIRSRVEVFRDNRLIDARFYDAGNRQLDTSQFPDGAYQISVRIREENGSERTEEYFFVRNHLLPPMNEPIIYAEVGKINKLEQDNVLPETTSSTLIHVGGAKRITENIAIEGELLSANNQQMLQTGIVHIGSGLQSQLNVMATTEDDWGISIRENYSTQLFSAGLDYRHIHQGDKNIADINEFDIVTRDTTQASASIAHELFGGRAFWRYRHLDLGNSKKSETYSVNFRKQLLRKKNYQFDWEIGASKDTDDYLINAKLIFSYRKKNNIYRISTSAQNAEFNDSRESDLLTNARWQHNRRDSKFGRLQSQLFYLKESNFDTTGVNLSSESRYGFNEIEVNKTKNSGSDTVGYSMRSQLSIASDFKNASIGGAQRNNSAVIVNLNGQPNNAKFEVFVNRQSIGFANVGKSTIVTLPPYETYDIRLESRSDSFLTFDETPRNITLYPGNVSTMNWDVSRVLVFIGKIIDAKGNPVINSRISNVSQFAGTDDRGWFQIETGSTDSLELQRPDGSTCKIELGEYDVNEDVHIFDELICYDTSKTITKL